MSNIITSKQLVEMFGSDKNKEYLEKNNRVDTATKKTILKKMSTVMNIVDLGGGNFEILEVYKEPKNLTIENIKENKLYSKLAPIIIKKLILNKMDSTNTLTLSLVNFYDFSQSIHRGNYNEIRYKKDLASEELKINPETILEFYKLINKNLQYKLEDCLNHLKKARLIEWYKIPYIKERKVDVFNVCSSLDVETRVVHRRATTKENQFHEDLKTELRNKYGIENEKDCYFGEKSKMYREEYEARLGEKNIMYFYAGYEVYYKDIEKCKDFVKSFSDFDMYLYSQGFSKNFIEDVIHDAKCRQSKVLMDISQNKSKTYRADEKYIADYEFLATSTLDFYYKDNIKLGCLQEAEVKGDYYFHRTEIKNA